MSVDAMLRRTRRRLILTLALRLVVSGVAVALLVLAVGAAVGAAWPLPTGARRFLHLLAAAVTVAVAAAVLWQGRFVWSLQRVALWIEEHAPHLRYALVSAVDPRCAPLAQRLEATVTAVNPTTFVRRAARRSVLPPALLILLGGSALAALPPASERPGGGSVAAAVDGDAPQRSRLSPLRATIEPPEYARAAGLLPENVSEPSTIAGLAGSRVTLRGPGGHDGHDGIGAQLGTVALDLAQDGTGWRTTFTMPDSAVALQLSDGEHRRLIVLAPRLDELPRAQLLLPARDTTMREAAGMLILDARLSDDFGVAAAWFEYIVTSGEGEGNFTFREGRVGLRAFDGGTQANLRATVPLSTFRLKPGDRLSVRAAVRDNNSHSGPGTGYSETRLLRLSRPGEYDSLAIEGAPPAVDSTLMTLRYLIVLTEEVHERRGTMDRRAFVDTAVALGRTTERLRDRVRSLQADQTMGGLFEGNPLLDTAYIELAQGAAALRVAEPGAALPHLREALRVLEEYAMAERYYTRGGTPDVLVDLERVRLSGKDPGQPGTRMPRAAADSLRQRLHGQFVAALATLRTDRDDAVERLLHVQVEAMRVDTELAGLLGAAIDALRDGTDAAPSLQRARWLLEGRAVSARPVNGWSGAW